MKLKALKLNAVSKAELQDREMNKLLGGSRCCICGCPGPSTTFWNGTYNHDGGASGYIPASGGGGWGNGEFAPGG